MGVAMVVMMSVMMVVECVRFANTMYAAKTMWRHRPPHSSDIRMRESSSSCAFFHERERNDGGVNGDRGTVNEDEKKICVNHAGVPSHG